MGMDALAAIAFFVFFVLLSERSGKKKPVPKRPEEWPLPPKAPPGEGEGGGIGFEIPRLEGAPAEEAPPKGEPDETAQLDAAREARYQELLRRAASPAREPARAAAAAAPAAPAGEAAPLRLSPENALQAVALAEILGRPKAYGRRNFLGMDKRP